MWAGEQEFDEERWLREIGWLRGLALRLVGDPTAADDLAQETARVSRERTGSWDLTDRGYRVGILRRLAMHRRREAARRRAREARAARDEGVIGDTGSLERLEIQRQLLDAVAALAPFDRRLVIARYFEDRSAAEIARALDIPAPTVRSRLARALEKLRTELDRRSGGDREKWLGLIVGWLGTLGVLGGAEGMSVAGATISPSSSFTSFAGGALALSLTKQLAVAAALVSLVLLALWIGGEPEGHPPVVSSAESRDSVESTSTVANEESERTTPEWVGRDRTMVGTVRTRHEDAPIAGALVVVVDDASGDRLFATTTDTSGEYRIALPTSEGVAGGGGWRTSRIEIEHAGYLPGERTLWGSSERWPLALDTVHLAAGHQIEGVVLGQDGAPVGEAAVTGWGGILADSDSFTLARRRAWGPRAETHSDADGRFSLLLPRGTATLLAAAEDRAGVASTMLPVADESPLIITIGPSPAIRGSVVDEDGSPVSDAEVHLWVARSIVPRPVGAFDLPDEEGRSVTVRTDDHGHFSIHTGGFPGNFRVEHPAFLDERSDWNDPGDCLLPGEPRTITLRRGISIRGSAVIATADGNLRPADARDFAARLDRPGRRDGRTEQDGSFILRGIDPTATRLTITVAGLVPRTLDLRLDHPIRAPEDGVAGEMHIGEVIFESGLPVSVVVTEPGGEPIADASVYVDGPSLETRPSVRTGPDGRGVLSGVAPGPMVIGAAAVGRSIARSEVEVAIGSTEFSLVLEPDASLSGRLVDPEGAPIAGGAIILELESPSSVPLFSFDRTDLTEESGRFRFPEVAIETGARLRIVIPGRLVELVPLAPLAPGEARDLGDVTVGGGANLAVAVQDAFGRPLSAVEVRLVPVSAEESQRVVVRTDASGAAYFRGLVAGAYDLRIQSDWHLPVERRIDTSSGDRTETIVLVEAGTWEPRIVDSSGEPVAGATVGVYDLNGSHQFANATTDADGRALVTPMPERAGRYSVHAHDYAGVFEEVASERLPDVITLVKECGVRLFFEPSEDGPEITGGLVMITRPGAFGSTTSGSIRSGVRERTFRVAGPGSVEVVVLLIGYAPWRRTVEVPAESIVDVEVCPEGPAEWFRVRVVGDDGEKVAGAQVSVAVRDDSPIQHSSFRFPLAATGDGGFEVHFGDRSTTLIAYASAPGYGETRFEPVRPGEEATITLSRPARLTVICREADGSPAVGRKVTVHLDGAPPTARHRPEKSVDPEGRVTFEQLPAQRVQVIALDDNRSIAMTSVTLESGGEHEVELKIPRSVEVFGTVSISGRPVEEGQIEGFFGPKIPLSAGGRFRGTAEWEDDTEEPRLDGWLRLPDGRRYGFSVPLVVGRPIDLTWEGLETTLRFVDGRGDPVTSVRGSLYLRGAIGRRTTTVPVTVDARGVAAYPDLPVGEYDLEVEFDEGFDCLDRRIVAGGDPVIRVVPSGVVNVLVGSDQKEWLRVRCSRLTPEGTKVSVARPSFHPGGRMRVVVPCGVGAGVLLVERIGRAPTVLDLEPFTGEAELTPRTDAGGRLRFEAPPEGIVPVRITIVSLDGPPLHPAIADRVWEDRAHWTLPVGTFEVTVIDADGAHHTRPVSIEEDGFPFFPW